MVVETFQNFSFSFDNKATILIFKFMMGNPTISLTGGIFETGAYGVPSKS